jgi:hypothetical protein
MDKKKLFGIIGALGVALASGAGSKIAEVVMKKTTEGGNEPEPDDGHKPDKEEATKLANECDLIKESIEEVEEEETTEE